MTASQEVIILAEFTEVIRLALTDQDLEVGRQISQQSRRNNVTGL